MIQNSKNKKDVYADLVKAKKLVNSWNLENADSFITVFSYTLNTTTLNSQGLDNFMKIKELEVEMLDVARKNTLERSVIFGSTLCNKKRIAMGLILLSECICSEVIIFDYEILDSDFNPENCTKIWKEMVLTVLDFFRKLDELYGERESHLFFNFLKS